MAPSPGFSWSRSGPWRSMPGTPSASSAWPRRTPTTAGCWPSSATSSPDQRHRRHARISAECSPDPGPLTKRPPATPQRAARCAGTAGGDPASRSARSRRDWRCCGLPDLGPIVGQRPLESTADDGGVARLVTWSLVIRRRERPPAAFCLRSCRATMMTGWGAYSVPGLLPWGGCRARPHARGECPWRTRR